MLLMPGERTNGLSDRIRLVNCNAEIRHLLTTSRMGKRFHAV
jgi:hypothetical protein